MKRPPISTWRLIEGHDGDLVAGETEEFWVRSHGDGIVEAVTFGWSPMMDIARPGVQASYVRGRMSTGKYDVRVKTEELNIEAARYRYLGFTGNPLQTDHTTHGIPD
mgnify:CR=1 FL=1